MYSTTLIYAIYIYRYIYIYTYLYTLKNKIKSCSFPFLFPNPRSSHIEIGVQNQAPSEGAQRQIAEGLLRSQFLLAQAESILNSGPAEAFELRA